MTDFKTNFVKDQEHDGNILPFGEEKLVVEVPDAEIITGLLYRKSRGSASFNIIQIEQSGHRMNPDKNKIEFEMIDYDRKEKKVSPMRKGDYKLVVRFAGSKISSDTQGFRDFFEIV